MTIIKNKTLIFFSLIILFFAISAFSATLNAQIANTTSNMSIKMWPENPGPFEKVSLKLVSYNIDLGRANISWYVNGKLLLSGIGKTYYSLTTGGVGSVLNINIIIHSSEISTINKSLTIIPGEIDMLWEATDSYTPPFYRGKALSSSESFIKITAVPNVLNTQGNKIKPSNMIYNWKRNYKFEKLFNKQSGYGKQSVIFRRKLIGSNEVMSVSASSFDDKIKIENKMVLNKSTPKIVFYQKHPLEGILYNKAVVGNFVLDESEATIVAEPYFFSSKNKDISLLSYVWRMNNKDVEDTESEKVNEIILRRGEKGGNSKISLNVRNVSRILQFVGNSFNVSF